MNGWNYWKVEEYSCFLCKNEAVTGSGGCILLDSSDLKYLYEDEDGSYVLDLAADYYGEIDFQMQYKQVKGDSFDWLYVDFDTLSAYVSQYGFHAQIIKEGSHYDYLVKLWL